MVKAITDTDFNTETDNGLVLIDFWATWCGPCRIQGPILDQLSEELDEDELKIVKMDVDENPATPQQFGIMSIPTLILKKDGEVVEKVVGVHNKEQIKQLVAAHSA
ncbi:MULTISPECIES: thioredoxin [unclassified Enterococcus]|uniref:thioredoxin n=1 Tax=unclassified Enterococcus TaxID=2608891 RepID=UPI00155624B1|nr:MULTISPECIES: thioredoxin [unclassified Enterococcus]MBS7577917.1 thioredoxin [Enterococcus sp. MMGLQ5-2]MBS7585222.1 thioredoxin [Enterococcus sp. MMGLQ5-1]NPD13079.1 thioredoxin [Enterococcus sp. MMGLQ5-1]NPD37747.1 thioredoxin [Enterococcus sp. MMGLQ5-2]